jgi:molybdopterin-guanine dinucleotide biosynthesis protein A
LVESIAQSVGEAAGSVALVGRTSIPEIANIECLPDLRTGLGPLSGVETALVSARGELNLIVACDLPLLESEWLKLLLKSAEARHAKCLVATDSNARVHPLCGVYRADCLAAVQQALDNGRLRLMEMLEELGAEHLEIDASLWNVNTTEEWHLCREFANGR